MNEAFLVSIDTLDPLFFFVVVQLNNFIFSLDWSEKQTQIYL